MPELKRIDRKLEHKGAIIDFYSDTMLTPDGNHLKFDFIGHKGAAAIVPVDDDGKLIMVKQYRPAIDRYTIEIPAGGLNQGEDMKTAAMRELMEETGYSCEEAKPLIEIYTTVAYCNEKIGIYYADKLTPCEKHLDEYEYVDTVHMSVEELTAMIYEGKIQDAKTVAAVLAYKNLKDSSKA